MHGREWKQRRPYLTLARVDELACVARIAKAVLTSKAWAVGLEREVFDLTDRDRARVLRGVTFLEELALWRNARRKATSAP